MAPKAAGKRKSRGDDHSDASSGLFVQDEPKRPAKRTRGNSLSRLDESGDDAAKKGSQGFQSWAKWLDGISCSEADNSKKSTKIFEQKANKQDKQLKSLLQKHEQTLQAQQQKFTSALSKMYSVAVQLSPTTPAASAGNTESIDEGRNLLQQAQELIADSRSTIQCFLDMNAALKGHKIELPTATLKKDKQDIREILACGREHGEMIAKCHLAPQIYASPNTDKTKVSGHQQTAADIFQDSRKGAQNGAGSVIAMQIRGFRQLATTISLNQSRG